MDLIRLEAGKQTQRKNTLSSGPSVTLPVRNSRSCNALAFNNVDPNYLAVGLDKVRGDSSLVIWDVSTLASSLALPLSNTTDSDNSAPAQPRPQPLLPRLENQIRFDSRMLQQHAATEVVSSLAFLPSSTNLILAGISHRWLRLFDLRSPSTPAVNVNAKVHGIATDPFDPHRIACYGDSTVTIWDARRLTHPVLQFTERDALADGAVMRIGATMGNIEFSSTRRGCLATLEKESDYVRFWDVLESRVPGVEGSVVGGGSSDGETSRSRDSMRLPKRSWANLPWPTGGSYQNQSPKETLSSSVELPMQRSFVLSDTRRSKCLSTATYSILHTELCTAKYFPRFLASFALVPNPKSSPSRSSNVMVVSKDGDLEVYAIYDAPKQLAWSSKGSLVLGGGLELKSVEGYKDSESEEDIESDVAQQSNPGRNGNSLEGPWRSRSRSSAPRAESRVRGRGSSSYAPRAHMPALFGRGDNDGFPALSAQPMGLSATRPGKPRTYSPASVRQYRSNERGEPSALQRRSLSRTDTIPADEPAKEQPPSTERRKVDRPTLQKVKESRTQVLSNIVQEDISMVMRQRAKAGYGLSQVCAIW